MSWRIPPPLASESRPFQTLDEDLQAALKAGLAAVPDSADNARAAFASSIEQHTRTLGQIAAHPVDALVVDSSLVSRVRPFFTPASAGDPAEDVSDSDTVRPMGLASLREDYLSQVQRDFLSRPGVFRASTPSEGAAGRPRRGVVGKSRDSRLRLISMAYVPRAGIREKLPIFGVEVADHQDVEIFDAHACYFLVPRAGP